jgi:hypothetical protein
MLDIISIDIFKQAKKCLWKNSSSHFMENHKRRMFCPFETVKVSSTVHDCFQYAELAYLKDLQESYMLGFDEEKDQVLVAFKEFWDINSPLEKLSPRSQVSHWQCMNLDMFLN